MLSEIAEQPAALERTIRRESARVARFGAHLAKRDIRLIVLVARGSSEAGRTPVDYRMAEFFVGRTWRRRGIGKLAVELILNRFAGRWEITEYLRNPVAVSFWRRVVANYTQGRYQERVTNGEVRQVFESGLARAQKQDRKPA